MKQIFSACVAFMLVAGCGQQQSAEPEATLKSGVDLTGMDLSVRPQDDYYAYANGGWIKETEIPADQFGWGSYITLRDDSLADVKAIVDEVAADVTDSEAAAKIGNFYNAYMDEARAETLGMSPLDDLFAEIDALQDHEALAAWFGKNN